MCVTSQLAAMEMIVQLLKTVALGEKWAIGTKKVLMRGFLSSYVSYEC